MIRRLLDMRKALAAKRWLRWVAVPAAAAAVIGSVISAASPPSIPAVALAAEPLYAKGARAKPTLTLALSVEFPTVGAQYVKNPGDTEDDSYSADTEYLGYFDANSCYTYNNDANADLRRFDLSGAATAHKCAGTGFSGNFMNWASSSAIDILRFGLTGGDRWQDTQDLTVLQRAVLPNSSVSGNFWNASNFPAKKLSATLAADAVPNNLRGTYTGTVYVANCLNRMHFGTAKDGNCDTPGNNSNLGVNVGSATRGPITSVNTTLPGGFTYCADENGNCAFTGVKQVAYGANSSWFYQTVSGGTACNNATFGDPLNGTAKKCYTRADPTGWSPSNPYNTATLSSDPFFFTRVSVCAVDGSGNLTDPRADLCLRYPSGKYKPVGNLQKYSDRVRVSAFGYLNDNTGNPNERNGGVLRAPMKYVGPKYFDANFSLVSGANPKQEWNETTGVFTRDPDSAGGPNSGTGSNWPGQAMSGVTNYLNQFGRTGTFGQYKTYDPVGELYYEAVRYIQGLSPTASAVSGVTDTLRDGFPVYTSWTDPHPAVSGMTDYSCVKNNIVGIGDVNTHNDKTIPGNDRTTNDSARSASLASNEPNFKDWTKVVGGFESNNSVSYVDGAGATRSTSNISANSPYNTARWGMESQNIGADNASYYMAGIAYWANTHDIRGTGWTGNVAAQRPGMRVKTYWLDVNEYGQQSTASTRQTSNQFFMTAKYGGFNDSTGTGNPFKIKNADGTVSDGNSAWNKPDQPLEAKNYYLSSSASGVLSALNEIFARIASEAASIAGGAISTQRLTSVGGVIYQAQFDPADWSGDLVAYPVTASGTTVTIGDFANSPWRNAGNKAAGAGGKLDERDYTTRKLFIGKTVPTASFAADPFLWANVETVVQSWMKTPPGSSTATATDSDTIGQNRLNFLRGDRSNEAPAAANLRKRGSALGDIVNSGVAYSGAPTTKISADGYATFQSTNASRTKALFVGANDGMLHAFNADTGAELFGYIPSWLVPKLNLLTAGNYTHRSYLDATPVVAEALVGSAWKTVLVGGTGGGGQGVFALDVTNPDPAATGGFSASSAMWEFTDKNDVDMGNVIGRPQILKFNLSAPGTTPSYKYFAVVASGVNNYVDDGFYSTDGAPTIFLLDLNKGKSDAWALGSNYYKIKLPVSTTAIASGIVTFTVRSGFADEVTQLYAGDLQGNLWKLDFTKVGFSDWGSSTDPTVARNKLSFFNTGGSTPSAIPMYVAMDAATTPNRQPITMAPSLVFNTKGSIVVAFGTGKFLEVPDSAGTYTAQSVYAVLDTGNATADSASPTRAIAGRGRLAAGSVSSGVVSVADFNWGRPLTDGDATARSGWYFDFPSSASTGERQISNFGLLGGQLVFGTVIPALNSCDNGTGKLYLIDALTGDGGSETSSVGMLGEPFLTQVGDSSKTSSDTTGKRQETARWQVILQGSSGIAAPPSLGKDIVSYFGRLSWREIFNYQELRN